MDTRIRLDTALVARKLCSSRTEAQELIKQGAVFVDGAICTKSARLVSSVVSIVVTAKRPFVSRGGEKLEGCLLDVYSTKERAKKALEGALVLDAGSSTGGFTDCVIRYGAKRVDCVDVGTSQLHDSLRADARIHIFENQDIRTFKSDTKYDAIVADVSFISLKDICSHLIALGTEGKTAYFILIKPQFEVGRGNLKKGIVKDQERIKEVVGEVRSLFEQHGLKNVHVFPSKLVGGDGNQEYFLYGTL